MADPSMQGLTRMALDCESIASFGDFPCMCLGGSTLTLILVMFPIVLCRFQLAIFSATALHFWHGCCQQVAPSDQCVTIHDANAVNSSRSAGTMTVRVCLQLLADIFIDTFSANKKV